MLRSPRWIGRSRTRGRGRAGRSTHHARLRLCAVYTATEQRETSGPASAWPRSTRISARCRTAARKSRIRSDQHLDSVITQLILGWQLVPRLGVQVNLPFIYRTFAVSRTTARRRNGRWFRRHVDHRQRDRVRRHAGDRDCSALRCWVGSSCPPATARSWARNWKKAIMRARRPCARCGRGTPGELARRRHGERHPRTRSALGSGSVDGIVGGEMLLYLAPEFFSGLLQYAVRREGSFDYRYANDLVFAPVRAPGSGRTRGHARAASRVERRDEGQRHAGGERPPTIRRYHALSRPAAHRHLGDGVVGRARERPAGAPEQHLAPGVPDYRIRAAAIWRF